VNTAKAGDSGHPEAHNQIVDAITEARTKVDAAEKTAEWASVTGKPTIPSDQASAVAALTARVEALEAAVNPPAEG
jgi:hypothetical protein